MVNAIRAIRVRQGMSQSQLAEAAGISLRTLQDYEQGRKRSDGAKLRTLLSIANALGVYLGEIIESDDLKAMYYSNHASSVVLHAKQKYNEKHAKGE